MALNKKVRRKPVKTLSNQKDYPILTFEQALDIVLAGKRAEGVRERTLRDYSKDWSYFVKWLNRHYEVETVDELDVQIFRDYINYLQYDRNDRVKYVDLKYCKMGWRTLIKRLV